MVFRSEWVSGEMPTGFTIMVSWGGGTLWRGAVEPCWNASCISRKEQHGNA